MELNLAMLKGIPFRVNIVLDFVIHKQLPYMNIQCFVEFELECEFILVTPFPLEFLVHSISYIFVGQENISHRSDLSVSSKKSTSKGKSPG